MTATVTPGREELIARLARKFPETFTTFGNGRTTNALAGNVVDEILDRLAATPQQSREGAEGYDDLNPVRSTLRYQSPRLMRCREAANFIYSLINYTDGHELREREAKQLSDLIIRARKCADTLSAPVPSPDGAGEHGIQCVLCGETLHDNELCDDAECPIGGSFKVVPSATGAAEPVDPSLGLPKSRFAKYKTSAELDAENAAPPVRADREAIADAFAKKFPAMLAQYSHFKIVDWFLSLPVQSGAGEGEAISQAAEWCRVERENIGAVDGYDYRSGEEFGLRRAQIELERLSRQPPQSSSEGEKQMPQVTTGVPHD